MPITDTFWKAYFGMLIDKYQITWMISYMYPVAEQTLGKESKAAIAGN